MLRLRVVLHTEHEILQRLENETSAIWGTGNNPTQWRPNTSPYYIFLEDPVIVWAKESCGCDQCIEAVTVDINEFLIEARRVCPRPLASHA